MPVVSDSYQIYQKCAVSRGSPRDVVYIYLGCPIVRSRLPPYRPDIGSWDPVAHGPGPLRGPYSTDISVDYGETQPLSEEKAGERGRSSGKGGGGGGGGGAGAGGGGSRGLS
jgi:hypothetical protein